MCTIKKIHLAEARSGTQLDIAMKLEKEFIQEANDHRLQAMQCVEDLYCFIFCSLHASVVSSNSSG